MPTKYVHFTDEQKEQARQTDLCELLRSQGETLKRSGTEYEWKDGSQKVTIRGNLWFHQYDRQGGDAIDFVKRFYNKEYPEAVSYLLGSRKGGVCLSDGRWYLSPWREKLNVPSEEVLQQKESTFIDADDSK